jgi:hypothetical protein
MAEQEKKLAMARKKKHYRFGGRWNPQPKSSLYTSNVAKIKDDIFNVGATSNPAKFTKSLKNIKTYTLLTIWSQTLFGNGDCPYGIFFVSLPVPAWGLPVWLWGLVFLPSPESRVRRRAT